MLSNIYQGVLRVNNIETVLKISATHAQIVKTLDAQLSIHGVSFSEFIVMYQLSLAPKYTMRRIDLAQKVGMSASGVTRLLRPMEKLKIVSKEPNPRDARVSFVKLSDVGKGLFDNAYRSLNDATQRIFEDIEAGEHATLLEILKKIN